MPRLVLLTPMRLSCLFAVLCTVTSLSALPLPDLAAQRWQQRVVVIDTPTTDDATFQAQAAALLPAWEGLRERDVLMLTRTGAEAFQFRLIGKDGGVKLTAAQPVTLDKLFAIIDAMPMRRAEMRAQMAEAFALPAIGEEVPLARIKVICEHYGLPELWAKIERDPPPQPFKSDGVTGWFDEWRGQSLYPAGFLHDLKYWAGYPGEDVERLIADAELMIDVARILDSTEMAETMFHGVRIGGAEIFGAPFSWGFGRVKP